MQDPESEVQEDSFFVVIHGKFRSEESLHLTEICWGILQANNLSLVKTNTQNFCDAENQQQDDVISENQTSELKADEQQPVNKLLLALDEVKSSIDEFQQTKSVQLTLNFLFYSQKLYDLFISMKLEMISSVFESSTVLFGDLQSQMISMFCTSNIPTIVQFLQLQKSQSFSDIHQELQDLLKILRIMLLKRPDFILNKLDLPKTSQKEEIDQYNIQKEEIDQYNIQKEEIDQNNIQKTENNKEEQVQIPYLPQIKPKNEPQMLQKAKGEQIIANQAVENNNVEKKFNRQNYDNSTQNQIDQGKTNESFVQSNSEAKKQIDNERLLYLKLKGIPFFARNKEVFQFLAQPQLDQQSILYIFQVDGQFMGECIVRVNDQQSYDSIIRKNNQKLNQKHIQIEPSDLEQWKKAKKNNKNLEKNQKKGQNYVQNFENIYNLGILKLRGLPFQATDLEIKQFFHEFQLDENGIVRIKGEKQKFSGECFILLTYKNQVQTAINQLNMQKIGNRYIELFQSNPQDFLSQQNLIKVTQRNFNTNQQQQQLQQQQPFNQGYKQFQKHQQIKQYQQFSKPFNQQQHQYVKQQKQQPVLTAQKYQNSKKNKQNKTYFPQQKQQQLHDNRSLKQYQQYLPQQQPQQTPQHLSQQQPQQIAQQIPQQIAQQIPQQIPQQIAQSIPQQQPQQSHVYQVQQQQSTQVPIYNSTQQVQYQFQPQQVQIPVVQNAIQQVNLFQHKSHVVPNNFQTTQLPPGFNHTYK